MNARKNEKTIHSTEICGLKKTNTDYIYAPKRKILFFLLSLCHDFDTEVNVFFPHRAVFNKSVPVELWPRGRFFQSHQRTQSWLLLSWEHFGSSPLDLHLSFTSECFSLQPGFHAHCFTASCLPLSVAKPAFCFVLLCFFNLNFMCLFLPTPVWLGEFCL